MTTTTDTSSTLEKDPPTGRWLLFVGLGALVVSLSQTILVPVLATLPTTLDQSVDTVQWLLTSTLLVAAVAVPVMGRLGDMFGKRRLLLIAVAALVIGCVLTAMTSNIVLLIIGRAIQGISAGAIPLGISLLSSLLPRERAGSAIATVSAMLGVGGALGVPLAGYVSQEYDFHALFWLSAVIGAIAFVGIALGVPESPTRSGGRVDIRGAALLTATLLALLLPLSQGSRWGWSSPLVIGLLLASVVLLGLFLTTQRRTREPLIDLKTQTRRPILLTNIASMFFGFALFASLIGTASFVQSPPEAGYGFGSSMLVGGLTLLPGGLTMLVLAPFTAVMARRIGASRVLALGAIILAAGWVVRIVAVGSLTEVIIGATIVGAGSGIGYAAMPAIINAHAPRDELASANGVNSLMRSLGSSLASAIGGAVLAGQVLQLGPAVLPTLGAYQLLFALCAGASVVAAVIALTIPREPVDVTE